MHERSEILAKEGNVAVRRCCTSHLVFACGPMTLTLDEVGLRMMARVLEEAVGTLDAMATPVEELDG